jgi:hypothetical protein
VRRDGIFGLVLVEIFVFSATVEDLGGNVQDVDQKPEEGSSHKEEDWKRMSLTRSIRRRDDTWLSEDGEGYMYITDSEERDLGGVRMAVMRVRSALPDS